MRFYRPDVVMTVHADGSCTLVDLMNGTTREYDDYMVPMRFQGWTDQVPSDLEDLAEQLMKKARR